MEGVCFVGVFLLIIFVWIYDEISKQVKGSNYSSRNSSSANKPVTRSKRGYCSICGEEVIIEELPDSISRGAFEDFGICEVCQMEIFMQNGGHF